MKNTISQCLKPSGSQARGLKAFVTLLFLILSFSGLALAAPGDLDPTFGTGGKVTTIVGIYRATVEHTTILADGKIVWS